MPYRLDGLAHAQSDETARQSGMMAPQGIGEGLQSGAVLLARSVRRHTGQRLVQDAYGACMGELGVARAYF
ncbi:hypothetical protein E2562_007822 [Oryza meyeriana var. granulata]|uniref:Uncharacterized protein n=1 Tax=Oryza meyeriana var. granulata TaxID=110450 RepID=A0A6G1F5B9_9ORYZ|nr:hypothetical protein E2562_007822 [Oryza meyeriana var. granulata]